MVIKLAKLPSFLPLHHDRKHEEHNTPAPKSPALGRHKKLPQIKRARDSVCSNTSGIG